MFNSIPCHTSVAITDDPRSPDHIGNGMCTVEHKEEITITLEDVLAISGQTIEEAKEEGICFEETLKALGTKLITMFNEEWIMSFEDRWTQTLLDCAIECIEQLETETKGNIEDGALTIVISWETEEIE